MEIYKIINKVNNKIYIGKTVYTAQRRWQGHIAEMKSGNNNALHNAMRKYGIQNFLLEIIETDIQTKDELSQKEIYYIQLYNSLVPNGYNIATGGEGGNGTHAQNLQHWREQNPDKVKANIDNLLQWRKNNPELAQKANQQGALTRKEKYPNIADAAHQASKKKVKCVETGEIFDSASAAGAAYGGNGAHIGQVCNGKRLTAYKKHWIWVNS